MPAEITADRIVRATTKHDDGFNAPRYAARSPMSTREKIVTGVVVGLTFPIFFITLPICIGIHRLWRYSNAQEKQREQSEIASGVIFAKVEKNNEGEDHIRLTLSTGGRVTCSETGGQLEIQVHGSNGGIKNHPDFKTIAELKQFYRDDIKRNSAYYVEKNPGNSLLELFNSACTAGNIDDLFNLMEKLNDPFGDKLFQNKVKELEIQNKVKELEKLFRNKVEELEELFQNNIKALEESIEQNNPQFKNILQVEVAKQKKEGYACSVTFDGSLIARTGLHLTPHRNLFEFERAITDNKTVIKISKPKTELTELNKVINSPDSLALQVNFLKLTNLCKNTNANFTGFQLKIGRQAENSTVTIIKDGQERGTVQFEGDLTLNDRLFEPDTRTTTDSIFKLKEIKGDDNLIPVINVKVDPDIWRDKQNECADVVNTSFKKEQFKQIRDDLHRNLGWLPESSTDEGVLTQDKYRELILGFTNAAELNELKNDEPDFQGRFIALSTGDKKAFLKSLYTIPTEKIKNKLHVEFLAFEAESQERLKRTFFGVGTDLEFYGTEEQFQAKFSTLSNENQALFLFAAEQNYKTPLTVLGGYFLSNGPVNKQLTPCPTTYAFKILPADAQKPKEVRIEIKMTVNYKSYSDDSKMPTVLVHEDGYAIYSVSFKKERELPGADIRLSDIKSDVVIHNEEGNIPHVCNNPSIVKAKLAKEREMQLQRERIEAQSAAYAKLATATVI